jgi:hypothetical protein
MWSLVTAPHGSVVVFGVMQCTVENAVNIWTFHV